MPVWIRRSRFAGTIQFLDLRRRQIPPDRFQILLQLLFVPRADHDIRHRRALQQPVQCHDWNRFASFFRHLIQRIHYSIQIFIGHRRSLLRCLVQSAGFRQWLSTAQFSCQSPPAQRAPHNRRHFLVDPQWHQLPFEIAPYQRVVRLMCHILCQPYFSEIDSAFIKCQPEKFEHAI